MHARTHARTHALGCGPWGCCRYAPVVFRFRTYAPPGLSPTADAYCNHMLSMPEMVEWCAGADEETWKIEQYEK